MKIDELKAKVEDAGLTMGKLPDDGGIVPMCGWFNCGNGCSKSCQHGCSETCMSGTTQK